MIGVAVFGASGYAGAELIRLIAGHPEMELRHVSAGRMAGKRLGEVLPSIGDYCAELILADGTAPLADGVDLAFTALPHGAAAATVARLLAQGCRVVDLSADFRHPNLNNYRDAYGTDHPQPALTTQAVYGLSEWQREAIGSTNLVANPGCYPTSVLLPLLPLLQTDLLNCDRIIVDAKSGTSGAGRSPKQTTLFCEINESIAAYGLPRHRHQWEMEEWAENLGCNRPISIPFTPHIIPMTRGMLATIYLHGNDPSSWHAILDQRYADEPFVRVLPAGQLPATGGVAGSNRCDIGIVVRDDHNAVLVSCIDNLLKGAAGQALQNANLMFALDEQSGLSPLGVWP
ncbi:MAG: N-acetyl-gamma-glutamyl-phosphate reductase [Mariprofundales bacterium]|nr:N-acetyl-gamma-glutamyl-phosphate reductase [Mariprofundales bacterium]